MAQDYVWPATFSVSTNPSVGLNGGPIPGSSTLIAGTGPTGLETPVSVDASGNVNTNVISAALPTGAATAAKQDTGNASLASIDAGIPAALGQTTMSASMPVVIASNQTAIPVSQASQPLPAGAATETTLAAFSAKTAGSLVPQAFDYEAITYVGATTDIDTVTYKTGGAGGTVVATLTMGYDGSSRLTSVTRT